MIRRKAVFEQRLQVIVLASQKGGVGKTTLAANLGVAAEIAGDGPAVLLDLDAQGSLAAWWNAALEDAKEAFNRVGCLAVSLQCGRDFAEHVLQ